MRFKSKSVVERFAPALLEGVGATALGFLGADLLFAAELAGLSPAATLIPAVTAGVLVTALRLDASPTA